MYKKIGYGDKVATVSPEEDNLELLTKNDYRTDYTINRVAENLINNIENVKAVVDGTKTIFNPGIVKSYFGEFLVHPDVYNISGNSYVYIAPGAFISNSFDILNQKKISLSTKPDFRRIARTLDFTINGTSLPAQTGDIVFEVKFNDGSLGNSKVKARCYFKSDASYDYFGCSAGTWTDEINGLDTLVDLLIEINADTRRSGLYLGKLNAVDLSIFSPELIYKISAGGTRVFTVQNGIPEITLFETTVDTFQMATLVFSGTVGSDLTMAVTDTRVFYGEKDTDIKLGSATSKFRVVSDTGSVLMTVDKNQIDMKVSTNFIDSTQVSMTDPVLDLNKDNPSTLSGSESNYDAGIAIKRFEGVDAYIGFKDPAGTVFSPTAFVIGVGNDRRYITPMVSAPLDQSIPYWDLTNKGLMLSNEFTYNGASISLSNPNADVLVVGKSVATYDTKPGANSDGDVYYSKNKTLKKIPSVKFNEATGELFVKSLKVFRNLQIPNYILPPVFDVYVSAGNINVSLANFVSTITYSSGNLYIEYQTDDTYLVADDLLPEGDSKWTTVSLTGTNTGIVFNPAKTYYFRAKFKDNVADTFTNESDFSGTVKFVGYGSAGNYTSIKQAGTYYYIVSGGNLKQSTNTTTFTTNISGPTSAGTVESNGVSVLMVASPTTLWLITAANTASPSVSVLSPGITGITEISYFSTDGDAGAWYIGNGTVIKKSTDNGTTWITQ